LRLLRGKTHPHPAEYFLWLGGFAVSLALLFAIGRIALRLLKDAQAASAVPASAFASEAAAALVRYD
jgi:hypothetical protein